MPAETKSESATTLPALDITAFTNANQRSLAMMAHIGADAMRHAIEINGQFMDFVRGRLKEDEEVAEALACCNAPDEAMEAVTGFYKTAFDQYADEMRILSEKTAKSMTDTMKTAETGLKRTVIADVPKT